MPVAFIRLTETAIEIRSGPSGRQGIRIASASLAAASPSSGALPGVSTITEVGAVLTGLLKQAWQAGRLGWHHGRDFLGAGVSPDGGVGPWVKIEDGGRQPPGLGGYGEVDGQDRLSGPALLTDDGERLSAAHG